MDKLPTADMRTNIGTWAVPTKMLPAVSKLMNGVLPNEIYDRYFYGQQLETQYFDTRGCDLRKAREKGDRYVTLRVRCYGESDVYALSAKTEKEKFRVMLSSEDGESLLAGEDIYTIIAANLPSNIIASLLPIAELEPLVRSAKIYARRYAVENDQDRYTLDVGVETLKGKMLPYSILEFKSTKEESSPSIILDALNLEPIKISKFLWATRP